MRLIDADELRPDVRTKDGTLCFSKSRIANAPTVETRPTATWERFGTFCNGNVDRKCSNCGSFDEQAENAEVPYCWFCGAKMEVK